MRYFAALGQYAHLSEPTSVSCTLLLTVADCLTLMLPPDCCTILCRRLRNLSVYLAANEEEALNYLFLGDTNRAIAETAMNKASSRSHCIFTVRDGDNRGRGMT